VAEGFSSWYNFPDGIVPVEGDDVSYQGIDTKWRSKNPDSSGNACRRQGWPAALLTLSR